MTCLFKRPSAEVCVLHHGDGTEAAFQEGSRGGSCWLEVCHRCRTRIYPGSDRVKLPGAFLREHLQVDDRQIVVFARCASSDCRPTVPAHRAGAICWDAFLLGSCCTSCSPQLLVRCGPELFPLLGIASELKLLCCGGAPEYHNLC